MKRFTLLLALLPAGCRSAGNALTVVGSAYVESERPEGRAVAKVEVRYAPPATVCPPLAPAGFLPAKGETDPARGAKAAPPLAASSPERRQALNPCGKGQDGAMSQEVAPGTALGQLFCYSRPWMPGPPGMAGAVRAALPALLLPEGRPTRQPERDE